MPLYEYECADCGGLFEKLRPIDVADPACPRCSSERVVRRISLFAATPSATTSEGPRDSAPSGGGCCGGGACVCGGH